MRGERLGTPQSSCRIIISKSIGAGSKHAGCVLEGPSARDEVCVGSDSRVRRDRASFSTVSESPLASVKCRSTDTC